MQFGIFDHLEQVGDLSELYESRLRLLERADAAGFVRYHKAEHHFTVLDAAPRGLLFLAAAAQRTRRIRLGTLVTLLPFQHPLQLLEELCQLDHLSAGRLDFGFGKGVSPVEHALWGNVPDDAIGLTAEVIDILRAGFQADELTHHGARYRFDAVPMRLRPLQRPHPPLWYPGNVEFAAARRLCTVIGGPVPAVAAGAARYRELVASATLDWNPALAEPILGVTQHVFVAPDGEQARRRAAAAWAAYHDHLTSLWRAHDVPLVGAPTLGGNAELALQLGVLVAGTPDDVLARVRALRDDAGIDYVVGSFAWGDLRHDEAMASLELFASDVMPAIAAN